MKKHKFLKTLLASLMALTVISTSAVPAIAEEAEAETEAEVVDVVEETSEEEGEEIVIDVPEEEEDEGGSEIIVDIPVDEGGEETGGIGVVNFDDNADDVTVTAEAPEGAFPEGTEMTAVTVDDQAVLDLIQETAGEDAEILAAIDITFTNEGDTVQPDEAVKVAFAAAGLTYTEDLRVVHVHEDEEQNLTATVLEPEAVTETEDGGIAFDADSFSVYAVVGHGETSRLTVKFVNGTTEIASTVVKKTDINAAVEGGEPGSLFNQIVYDPGAGTLGSGQVFRGWTTNANYTDADVATGKNIDAVREEVKAMLNAGVTDGDSVTYYAMIYNVFHVTYKDEVGVVIKNDSVLTKANSTDYTIDESYTPKTSDQEFQGWHISPAANATLADGTAVTETATYKNLTGLKLNGSIILSVVAPKGAWLIFKENGSNVSYTPPQFVEDGKTTKEPDDPERVGYTFGGWYTDSACTEGNEFTAWNAALENTTTVYAKWTPVATANYTVIIWKQNVDGENYDFDSSLQLSGNTGTNVNSISATGTGDGRYATIDGTPYQWTGFHLDHYDTNVQIKPEGTSVVNVYYNRNLITLNFYTFNRTNGYTQTNSTNQNLEYFGRFARGGSQWSGYYYYPSNSGSYYYRTYLLTSGNQGYTTDGRTYNGNYIYVEDGEYIVTYSGNRYIRNGSWNTTPYRTVSGLYGSSLADANFTWPNDYNWYDQHGDGGSVWGTRTTFLDAFLPSDGSSTVNFYAQVDAPESTITIRFHKQNADLNGYTLANTVYAQAGNFYISDKYNGFTAFEYSVDGGTRTSVGAKDTATGYYNGGETVSFQSTLDIYFNRNIYNISFQDGVFLNGNGIAVEGAEGRGQFREVKDITLGADITEYNDYKPTLDGYVFSGWYVDDTCTTDYTFGVMPEGLVVYAKWVQVQYRVFLHPNVPSSEANFSMGDQDTSFRVDIGENISAIHGTRDDYELVGWYSDEACTQQFNFEAYTLNDSNTDVYDKTRSTELDKYGNPTEATNKDVDRPWITRSKDLYAKWRSKLLGAEGITVVYEAGAGTFSNGSATYTDPLLYKDLAMSTATTATTPTDTTKFEFSHWVVQKWNGSEFEPTNETVLPGDTFVVRKAYAQVTENPGSTSENPSYTYTVKLCAEYKAIEAETKTHIYWYANNGTTAKVEDNDLSMNQPVNIEPANRFSYAGYVFIGWSRWSVNTKPSSPTDTTNLWLVYDAANNKFTCDGVDVTQVACDEASPYHDLYAVWQYVGEYHVRYSSDPAKVYDYTMPRDAETTVTLLEHLHSDNYLYGGYYDYSEFNFGDNPVAYTAKKGADDAATNFQKTYWAGKTAFTTMPANAMKPTAGVTYYIKEVPDYYLQPFNQYYFKENYGNFLTRMYAMTAIDDGRYSELGFASLNKDYAADTAYNYNYAGVISSSVIANTLANVYATVKFETASKKNPTQIRAAADLTAVSDALGYVGAVDITSISHDKESDLFYNVDKSFNGVCFNFVPYYVTLDGVTVYGKIRKANCGTGYVSTFVPTNSVITSGEISALTKGN